MCTVMFCCNVCNIKDRRRKNKEETYRDSVSEILENPKADATVEEPEAPEENPSSDYSLSNNLDNPKADAFAEEPEAPEENPSTDFMADSLSNNLDNDKPKADAEEPKAPEENPSTNKNAYSLPRAQT
nr:circumsporozoite protein-like [Misgurnus anguillicaudatus]